VNVLNPQWLGRYDSLFVSPHGEDVALGCPARLLSEAASGRRALVLALFEPAGVETTASHVVRELGAQYAAAGIPSARERGSPILVPFGGDPRGDADQEAARQAARLLTDIGPKVQPLHVYAPLGLGRSLDHLIAYEAAVRAFASEAGRNLFLYEERPEAFVPGAVRTRLALLGARLPPGAAKLADQTSVVRHLWRVGEPESLRGEAIPLGARLASRLETWRRHRIAAPWNPLRALGPRLHPVVHVADEEARSRAQAVAEAILPKDRKGRARSAQRFNMRATALGKTLGGVYHAERLWLFLPAHDGLPEIQHPLEAG
jgi:LmbE family N-acetylglucosaminyl deacetylase